MTSVLLVVEDPGAITMLRGVIDVLQDTRSSTQLHTLAIGHAITYCQQYSIPHTAIIAEDGDSIEEIVEKILVEHKPKVLFVGTSENISSPAFVFTRYARKRHILSIGCIDAFGNAEYRFRGNSNNALAFAPDILFVPDQPTQKAFSALGFASKSVHVVGHPVFDELREKRLLYSSAYCASLRQEMFPDAQDKMIIVFVSEVSTGLGDNQFRHSSKYTLHGSGLYKDRTSIVIEEFLHAIESHRNMLYTVLRLHPKNTFEELAHCIPKFNGISSGGSIHDILACADSVVGMTTTALLEASALGKKTLSIVPRIEEQTWLSSIAAGITASACTRSEVVAECNQLCTQRGQQSPEYIYSAFDALYPQDAIANMIEKIQFYAVAK